MHHGISSRPTPDIGDRPQCDEPSLRGAPHGKIELRGIAFLGICDAVLPGVHVNVIEKKTPVVDQKVKAGVVRPDTHQIAALFFTRVLAH